MPTSSALCADITCVTFQSHLTFITRHGKLMGICTWPKHVFVDHNGLVRFEHAGYGGMEDFEDVVVELLQEAGNKPVEEKEQDDPKDEIHDIYGTHFYGMPPEICIGYSRLRRFGNNQTLKPEAVNVVVDPGSHDVNIVYLRGRWIWRAGGSTVCTRQQG